MHPAVALWIIGLALIIVSWYIPNGLGYGVLGVIALIVGTIIGLKS
jgi:membrane-bound ClpP family serine protease